MYAPHIWKKKKKKKGEGEEDSEKDKLENENDQSRQKSVKEGKSIEEDGDKTQIHGTSTIVDGEQDLEGYEDYCPFQLDMGYKPKPEEVAQDETVSS